MNQAFKKTLKTGFKKGLSAFWFLSKIMVPTYILIYLLKLSSILNLIADFFAPYMKIFGLPGEAALALVVGNLVNIYAALAVISSIPMEPAQITVISVMVSISHSQIVETTVVQQMRSKFLFILFLRISVSILLGILLKILIIP